MAGQEGLLREEEHRNTRKTVETQAWYKSTVHTLDCEEFEAFMQHGFQTSWPNGRKYRIIIGFWRHLGPSISSFCRLFPVGPKETDRDGCHHVTQASQQQVEAAKRQRLFQPLVACGFEWTKAKKKVDSDEHFLQSFVALLREPHNFQYYETCT